MKCYKISCIACLICICCFFGLSLAENSDLLAGNFTLVNKSLPNGADLPLVENITITINASNFTVEKDNGYDIINMSEFSQRLVSGDPMLLGRVYNVLLPSEVDYVSLKLEVVSVKSRALEGVFNIKPTPLSAPLTENASEVDNATGLDYATVVYNASQIPKSSVYSTDANYPENIVRLLVPGQMRKWKFVPVEFVPFQYNPVTGKLTSIESVTVNLSYNLMSSSPAAVSELMADTVMDNLAPDMFVNYQESKGWYLGRELAKSEPSLTIGYVIITTNAIRINSAKLNAFVTHKQDLGYTVQVVTEDDFGSLVAPSPNYKADKIRQWLKDNYVSKNIMYVLLIGNPTPYSASGEGDIPMKMCWPRYAETRYPEYRDCPTDAFYADLTGNWDKNGNGFFGELADYTTGGLDFAAEICVGRIPVYNADYTTLDSILQKTIDYESSSNTAWRKSALLPMSYSDSGTDGAYLAEQMKNNYLNTNGYSTWSMYQKGTGACAVTSGFPVDQELRGGTVVRDRWAADDYGIMTWWGHGSSTSTSIGYGSCWDGAMMYSSYCPSLDNSHPSFAFLCSCLNGYPEDANNLQYSVLKNGGIASVSATRVSWYLPGLTNFVMNPSNSGLAYEYNKRLVGELPAGDSLMQMRTSIVPYDAEFLMNFFDFNVYGDPSVSIKALSTPATWTSLGGYLTSKHSAIMDYQGRRHVFARGGDNALWDNVDGTWVGLGGVLASAPYAAKDNYGRIHIVARGTDNALWDYVFDTASWTGGWRGMGGSINSMATAAMEPTNGTWMKIAVRGSDNSLWLCEFNVNDLSSFNWIGLGGSLSSWPFAIFDQNSRLHIFVAGADNALWDNRGVLSSGEYVHSWHGLGGVIQEAPFSILEPGQPNYLAVMVQGADNALWTAYVNGLSNPETCTWRGFGGVLGSEPFASTDTSGRVHTFVRGGDGVMWEKVFSSNPWNPSGALWIGHGGRIIGSPQALLDGQTYAYVQGGDSAIWRKVFANSVPSSSVAEVSEKGDSPVEPMTPTVGGTGDSRV